MCFALFMIMLDNTVVNVALPSIQRDLGAAAAIRARRDPLSPEAAEAAVNPGGSQVAAEELVAAAK